MSNVRPLNANKILRAVVFHNYPSDLYQRSVEPKFPMYGIEVIRTVNMDKGDIGITDVGDAGLIICLVDLMGHGQAEHVKQLAKKTGKKYAALKRQSSTWESALGRGPIAITNPTTPSEIVHQPTLLNSQEFQLYQHIEGLNQQIAEHIEWIAIVEAEVSKAKQDASEFIARSEEKMKAEIEDLKRQLAARTEPSLREKSLSDEMAHVRNVVDNAKNEVTLAKDAQAKLAAENAELRKQAKARPTSVRAVDDTHAIILSYKTLVRLGDMTPADAFVRIANRVSEP